VVSITAGQGSSCQAGEANSATGSAGELSALPDEKIVHDEPIIFLVTKLHQDQYCNCISFQI
jgi:hypothetical protein